MGAALLGSAAAGAVLGRVGAQQEGLPELIGRTLQPAARSASAGAVLGDVGAALLGSPAAGAVLRRIGPQQEGFPGLIRRALKPAARSASAGAVLGDMGAALLGSSAAGAVLRRIGPQQESFPGLIRPHVQPSLWRRPTRAVFGDVGAALLGSFAAGAAVRAVLEPKDSPEDFRQQPAIKRHSCGADGFRMSASTTLWLPCWTTARLNSAEEPAPGLHLAARLKRPIAEPVHQAPVRHDRVNEVVDRRRLIGREFLGIDIFRQDLGRISHKLFA